eukprot:TRINITY_DN24669_c0_g1_i1.p1 TRINITY_DN24669_c0_g1~~TRINITY_DN24669_c0_g1_i1.p1  ORF type:complete len:409 (+),score=88.33 TRINITY_DN24669_c0_g1_i1:74-1300(+)
MCIRDSNRRSWDPDCLAKALSDPTRPTFLIGSVPPREGTSPTDASEICDKFIQRARCLANDGFIVYDIQDEASRTNEERPFPFRRTLDPVEYASLFPPLAGKSAVVYKAVNEPDDQSFDGWLDHAMDMHGHRTLNLVGSASSRDVQGIGIQGAAARVSERPGLAWGAVTIAERHTTKGNEHLNMLRKTGLGAKWFISQAVYDADATIQLLNDYGTECRRLGKKPAKVILTFAPCGRLKTLAFIKWLGIQVPHEVEQRISEKSAVSKQAGVDESMLVCRQALQSILDRTATSGVPLGVSVESVSGFKEEIEGAFVLFQQLQSIMLDAMVAPWGVNWFAVPRSVGSPPKIEDLEEGKSSLEQAVVVDKQALISSLNRTLEQCTLDELFVVSGMLGGVQFKHKRETHLDMR